MTVDDRFRRQLATELDRWVAETLIAPQQRDRLRQHYQLDRLNSSASNRFTTVLLTIGSILIGLGAISFVAANWDSILPSVRAIGILALMLGFDIAGYQLWQGSTRAALQRLGTALLLVGQLMLGASIALMAQWLQISGPPSGLFLWWGIGVTVMAYSLRHVFSGALSVLLILAAFFSGLNSPSQAAYIDLVIDWMPLLIPAIFLPLAYWCHSRWIFAFATLATCFSFVGTTFARAAWSDNAIEHWFLLGSFAIAFGLWAGSFCHQRYLPQLQEKLGLAHPSDRLEKQLDFAPIAQFLSLFGWLSYLYVLGFADTLYRWGTSGWDFTPLRTTLNLPQAGLPGLFVAIYWAIALIAWIANWRDRQSFPQPVRVMDTAIAIVAASMLLILHIGSFWGFSLIAVNALYFGLSGTLAWQGLQLGIRWRYWLGLLALTLQILSRFFEYDTGLLVKSLVLVACGIGIILAGLSFERRPRSPQVLPHNS
ncbi:DUF2157 domain-containing protein [Synechococcus sp. PCC 7336]|uniref:DUF2157 domain-containing protein n=1 Tax=Synechococcus sp. PCC 7336 TaxID=195250 RepID=UPI00034DC92A|nr:DUF2157 domain-containing protein [Synechococcus sp. PCC 7336]